MEHIKRQLNINLNKKGLAKIAQASYVCYIFEEIKDKLLGENIVCQATSFKGGVLKIKAPNSIVASEIRFKSQAIKEKIKEKIGKNIISKIDIKV